MCWYMGSYRFFRRNMLLKFSSFSQCIFVVVSKTENKCLGLIQIIQMLPTYEKNEVTCNKIMNKRKSSQWWAPKSFLCYLCNKNKISSILIRHIITHWIQIPNKLSKLHQGIKFKIITLKTMCCKLVLLNITMQIADRGNT